MKSKLYPASSFAVAATLLTAVVSAQGSGAVAQDTLSGPAKQETLSTISRTPTVSQAIVQPLPAEAQEVLSSGPAQSDDAAAAPTTTSVGGSLAELVAEQAQPETLSPEMRCLAGAIYFEAKSEPLPGQLAVGRVIVNRSKSGRFPASYCGVVYQPSQFSFIRGRSMPAINTTSQDWHEAVAIAQIADSDAYRSQAEGALFFHAARVSPSWRAQRIARIGNHVFYR